MFSRGVVYFNIPSQRRGNSDYTLSTLNVILNP